MPSCVFTTCRNHSGFIHKSQGITFHRFPKGNDAWKSDWVEIIRNCRGKNDWMPSKTSVICSIHFDDNDLYTTKNGLRRVVTYAVPKKFMFLSPNSQEKQPTVSNVSYDSQEMRENILTNNSPNVQEKETAEPNASCDSQGCSLYPSKEIKLESSVSTDVCEPSGIPRTSSPLPQMPQFIEVKTELFEEPSAFDPSSASSGTSPVPQITQLITVKREVCELPMSFDPSCASSDTLLGTQAPLIYREEPVIEPALANKFAVRRLKDALTKKQIIIDRQALKIKTLNQKVRRLQNRNISLKQIVENLQRHDYVDTDVCDRLNENIAAADLFINYNRRKLKKNIKYTPAIKKFCLTLNGYSPKAYDYIRQTFVTCLPNRKSLAKWSKDLEGDPTLAEESS